MVFESGKESTNKNSKPSLKRVAKKKSNGELTKPIPLSQATNKIERRDVLSDEEIYKSDEEN